MSMWMNLPALGVDVERAGVAVGEAAADGEDEVGVEEGAVPGDLAGLDADLAARRAGG